MKYAIAGKNLPFAKDVCKRKGINATFHPAPYGQGYDMYVENMTKGEFKKFLRKVLELRKENASKMRAPIVSRLDLEYPHRLLRVAKAGCKNPNNKCFRISEEDFLSVFG